jgi:hypothetical protein
LFPSLSSIMQVGAVTWQVQGVLGVLTWQVLVPHLPGLGVVGVLTWQVLVLHLPGPGGYRGG